MPHSERASRGAPQTGCTRPDLALWLPLWDELESTRRRELFEHAGTCSECGAKIDLLRRADQWLEGRAEPRPAGVCPPPDDLYDFGRGPGSRRLSEPERLSIRAHLSSCAECAGMLETLAVRPPAPLLYDLEPEAAPVAARRRFHLLAPLAAAAAALLAVVAWRWDAPRSANGATIASAPSIRFPSDPPLRGQSPSELLFPRDRVLRNEHGLWSPLVFEIAPQSEATSYRVILRRHEGGAFDVGTEVVRFESEEPILHPGGATTIDLAVGHYTWEAWAVVHHLDLPLGSRDFEVVVDATLSADLAARSQAPEPTRSESILHLLHDAGFVSDARAFARTLPPSPERDAYLARRPGR